MSLDRTNRKKLGLDLDMDITDQINRLEDGSEITMVFDNSSKYTHISLYKENPKTHARTLFVSYTPANGFSGNIELFKFKINKHNPNQKIEVKKKGKIRTKTGIEVNISLNPSLKWHWSREKESE